MNQDLPGTACSKRVPTEYDVERRTVIFSLPSLVPSLPDLPVLRLPCVVLIDDRSRRFVGFTLNSAFRRAERAQDPADPIHHPPYPNPEEVPLP